MDIELKELTNDALNYYYDTDFSLSLFLSKLLRIARKAKDPILKFIIRMDTTLLNESENKRIRLEFKKDMIRKEYASEEYQIIYETIISDWMKRREMSKLDDDDNKVLWGKTIFSLENTIASLEQQNDYLEVPSGLASLDIYSLNNEYKTIKSKNLFHMAELKEVLYKTKDFYFDYLTELEEKQKNNFPERKEKEYAMPTSDKVFIIHGSDEARWRELKDLLTSLNLDTIELSQMPSASHTLIDKFEKYAKECNAAIAILSTDDFVEDKSGKKYYQARPNVLFELGWFYAKLGKERVLLVYENKLQNEIPSDLQGIVQLRYEKKIEELYRALGQEFEMMGLGNIKEGKDKNN